MRRAYHGGQNARDWRRKVAALASRQREDVRTLKFRLDGRSDDLDFQTASQAYDVTEGRRAGQSDRAGVRGTPLRIPPVLQGFRNTSVPEPKQISRGCVLRCAESTHGNRESSHHHPVDRRRFRYAPKSTRRQPARMVGGRSCAPAVSSLERTFPKGRRCRPTDPRLAAGIARAVAREFDGWRDLAENNEGALACAAGIWRPLEPLSRAWQLADGNRSAARELHVRLRPRITLRRYGRQRADMAAPDGGALRRPAEAGHTRHRSLFVRLCPGVGILRRYAPEQRFVLAVRKRSAVSADVGCRAHRRRSGGPRA